MKTSSRKHSRQAFGYEKMIFCNAAVIFIRTNILAIEMSEEIFSNFPIVWWRPKNFLQYCIQKRKNRYQILLSEWILLLRYRWKNKGQLSDLFPFRTRQPPKVKFQTSQASFEKVRKLNSRFETFSRNRRRVLLGQTREVVFRLPKSRSLRQPSLILYSDTKKYTSI